MKLLGPLLILRCQSISTNPLLHLALTDLFIGEGKGKGKGKAVGKGNGIGKGQGEGKAQGTNLIPSRYV